MRGRSRQAAAGLLMHRIHLREILRDAAIARAIRPTIARGELTFAETHAALLKLNVPRAGGIARVVTSNWIDQPALLP